MTDLDELEEAIDSSPEPIISLDVSMVVDMITEIRQLRAAMAQHVVS